MSLSNIIEDVMTTDKFINILTDMDCRVEFGQNKSNSSKVIKVTWMDNDLLKTYRVELSKEMLAFSHPDGYSISLVHIIDKVKLEKYGDNYDRDKGTN